MPLFLGTYDIIMRVIILIKIGSDKLFFHFTLQILVKLIKLLETNCVQ